MTRPVKIALGVLGALVLVVLLFFAVLFWGLKEPMAAPEPAHVSPELKLEDQTSTVRIPISGNLQIFEDILNKEIAWRLADINEPKRICLKTKSKLLPDISCRLIGKVERGRIKLTGAGQNLRITIPVSARVQAQDIGGIVKRKTATGSMIVAINAKLGLTRDWRPTAKLKANYKWGTGMGVDILGRRVDFSSRVDPQIRKIIAQIEKRLPRLINRLNAKKKAQQIWAEGFTSARIKSKPEIWARFTPEKIGFAGYTVRGRQLIVNLAAQAQTQTLFGPRPIDAKITPIPNLMATLPQNGIHVQVPVHVPYSVFKKPVEDAMKLGEFQSVKLDNGWETQARFNDVEIFGTDGAQIAIGIGVTIKSRFAWSGLIDGKIWIIAKPLLDITGKKIGVSNLSVVSRTDSPIFNMLVGAISADEIDKEFISKISYDFTNDYDDGLRKADDWLQAEPLEGFVFRGNLISADIDRLHVLADGFIVQTRASGNGRMHYAPGEADRLVAKRRERRRQRESDKNPRQ